MSGFDSPAVLRAREADDEPPAHVQSVIDNLNAEEAVKRLCQFTKRKVRA